MATQLKTVHSSQASKLNMSPFQHFFRRQWKITRSKDKVFKTRHFSVGIWKHKALITPISSVNCTSLSFLLLLATPGVRAGGLRKERNWLQLSCSLRFLFLFFLPRMPAHVPDEHVVVAAGGEKLRPARMHTDTVDLVKMALKLWKEKQYCRIKDIVEFSLRVSRLFRWEWVEFLEQKNCARIRRREWQMFCFSQIGGQ